MLEIDEPSNEILPILCRNELSDGWIIKRRIGIKPGTIFERKLLSFNQVMQMIRAAKTSDAKVETLKDLKHLQNRDALPVRWQLPHVVAPVAHAYGLDPLGFVLGEIFVARETTIVAYEHVDRMGDFATVKSVTSSMGDLLQRFG